MIDRTLYALLAALVAALVSLPGCGGSPGTSTEGERTAGSRKARQTASDTPEEEPTESKPKSVDPDDVWFDKPLQEAGNRTPLGGTAPPQVAAAPKTETAPMPEPKAETPMPAAATGEGWETVIDAESLDAEIKKVRSELKDSLSTVSKYNGNYKEKVQMNAAVLAALAAVVPSHPANPSWEPDAKYVRDLAADIQAKAKGLGNESYDPTLKAWEPIEGLFNREKPAGLPESANTMPFPEVVRRGPAMKRMQAAYDHLKSNVATADILKKEQGKALQELGVLAMLNRVIASEGYDSADEEEYIGFVQALEKATQEAIAATKAGDHNVFSDSLNRMYKACNDCHGSYRFGS